MCTTLKSSRLPGLPPPVPGGGVGEAEETDSIEYASEILITKSELEEKNRLVLNLQNQGTNDNDIRFLLHSVNLFN
jgi:hypothetical protein